MIGGQGAFQIMLKVPPHPDYPPEEGRYIRGNDSSPVVVVIILNRKEDEIPPEIEKLVRTGVESGAALAGTVQTENIGFEKIICNVVANPNIRYAILSGPESEGHLTGEAFKALFKNGVDEKKRIIGTNSPHPLLYNLPIEFIERFRKQVALIDLQFRGTPELIRKAVWSCYQETPVDFEGHSIYDIGAFPELPLSGKITQRVMQPWTLPKDEKEAAAVRKMQDMIEKLKRKREAKS
jgi:tetrahydromethanopterin S-methyltransferase subunit A